MYWQNGGIREKLKVTSFFVATNQIIAWQNTSWYKDTHALKNNVALYQKHQNKATDLLFKHDPEELVVVEFVNPEKKIINFIKDKTKSGFFKYDATLKNPKVGELYQVRIQHIKDSMYKMLTARVDENSKSEVLKIVTGIMRVSPAGFGFVDDVFVDKSFISHHHIKDGSNSQLKSILSFN